MSATETSVSGSMGQWRHLLLIGDMMTLLTLFNTSL